MPLNHIIPIRHGSGHGHRGLSGVVAVGRGIDLGVSALAALLALPLMLVLGVAVLLSQGAPILFRQERVGMGGKAFTMPKFRSMREAYDASGAPLPDDMRVTTVGRFLRRFRLDELPGLFSIIAGDMAIVGPRPLPRAAMEAMPNNRERTRVRPGLTGLAQVSGNTLLSPREKIALDLLYVHTRSVMLDIRIIFRTIGTLVLGERRDEQAIADAVARFERLASEGPAQ
jgi:lipopolysaccharide/colanic/teichoic acid biosynthesis glycosyltransferase